MAKTKDQFSKKEAAQMIIYKKGSPLCNFGSSSL